MIKKSIAALAFCASPALTGCIIVDEEPDAYIESGVDAVQANALAAQDTCGADNVDEVTSEGFTCKTE